MVWGSDWSHTEEKNSSHSLEQDCGHKYGSSISVGDLWHATILELEHQH